jgi:hypothetical protein
MRVGEVGELSPNLDRIPRPDVQNAVLCGQSVKAFAGGISHTSSI